MVSVMVMTPIHMDHGHASLEIIGLVISVHILGMYAFSPLVGWLVDRVGSIPVLAAGGITLLASLALAGSSHPGASWILGVGLFLLGVGWSLGAVAASTLLTAATPGEYRPQVQGTTDMIVGFTAAAGGAVAGLVVGWLGFGGSTPSRRCWPSAWSPRPRRRAWRTATEGRVKARIHLPESPHDI